MIWIKFEQDYKAGCSYQIPQICLIILISLKFVPKGAIDNKPALVQVMAWHGTGAKPLPEPMLTQFTDAYICGTKGRWVDCCQIISCNAIDIVRHDSCEMSSSDTNPYLCFFWRFSNYGPNVPIHYLIFIGGLWEKGVVFNVNTKVT